MAPHQGGAGRRPEGVGFMGHNKIKSVQNHNEMLKRARSLRKEMTPWERKLWYDFLRRYPVRFRKQHILGGFFLDFYCAAAGLVVELDGDQHYESLQKQHDALRTQFLNGKGILVVRYRNRNIDRNFSYICDQINFFVQSRLGKRVL